MNALIDAPQLVNASIKVGQEPSGWVARNKRTLINAEPGGTFLAAGVTAATRSSSSENGNGRTGRLDATTVSGTIVWRAQHAKS